MVAIVTEKPQIARRDLIRLRNPGTGEYLHLSGSGATKDVAWSWCGTWGRADTLEQRANPPPTLAMVARAATPTVNQPTAGDVPMTQQATLSIVGLDRTSTGPMTEGQFAAAARKLRKSPPTKQTDEDKAVSDCAFGIAASQLTQFIERVEGLEEEKKEVAEQIKEVMAEAKGRGYDTKAMRKLIALRKRDPGDVAEEEAVLEMYKAALGIA